MRLEHHPVSSLKRDLAAIVGRHVDLSHYRLFFFGSRVAGTSTDRSDIDVGIEGPAEVPSEAMGAIREEIEELPTLYSIDVVDFGQVSPEFRSFALRHVEQISREPGDEA